MILRASQPINKPLQPSLSNFFGSPMESDIYPEENLTQLIDFMR
jgi:hypothetical protein